MLIFKQEQHVRTLVLEHAAEAQLCLEATPALLAEYFTQNAQAFSSAGAFMPVGRSDVYRLVESLDKLARRGEDVAIFLCHQPPEIAPQFQADYTDIRALNVDCTEQLHDALEIYFKPKGKLKELHQHTRQVGQLESEVDQRQAGLMQHIFGCDLELSAKIRRIRRY